MNLRRFHISEWIALVLFAALLVGAYVRLYFSLGFLGYMDEAYWVASSLMSSLGGRPYHNELYIQQTASLLYEPLVWIYYKVFGNFAIMLFVRHLYFALSLIVSGVYFQFLQRRTDLITALAVASLPLVGGYWGEPSLGYNAIGGLCFGAGALLAVEGYAAASGVFFSLSVGAYPTLIGGVIAFWILHLVAKSYLKLPVWREVFVSGGVTGLGLGLFIGSLIWREGFESLQLVYRFSTAHSSMGSFLGKVDYGFHLWLAFMPPWYAVLGLFAVWISAWRKFLVPWSVFAAAMTAWIFLREPPEQGPFYSAAYMLMIVSSLPMVLLSDFRARWQEKLIWTAAAASTLLTCWSSALTLYTTVVTGTYAVAMAFVLSSVRGTSRWLSLVLFVIPLCVFAEKNVWHVGDDGDIADQSYRFTSGGLAGIGTTWERHQFLAQIQEDLNSAKPRATTVLFYNEFPMGYLMSDLQPATLTMFLHTLRESGPPIQAFYRDYYSNPANRPDIFVRFRYFVEEGVKKSVEPEQFKPNEDVFWDFLPSTGDYVVYRDRDAYTVFKKKSLL